jgi:hypothetical protein
MKTMAWPSFSVSFEREELVADFMHEVSVPDEKWNFVDKKGHGHFWKGKKLPTCKLVVTGTHWVGDEYDGTEYEIKEWQCRTCGETIQPGFRKERPAPVLGPTWVTVSFDEGPLSREEFVISVEEYAQSVEAWRDHLRGLRR